MSPSFPHLSLTAMKPKMWLPRLLCSAAFALPMAAFCEEPVPPVRIMPLGDSITQGYGAEGGAQGGYRSSLYSLLDQAGYVVDFVGSLSDTNNPTLPDVNHQGLPGAKIEDLRNKIGVWFKETEDPDVILLEIGTNDFTAGGTVEQAQDQLKNLIASLSTTRPYAKIIVASLPPRTDSVGVELQQQQFNGSLPDIVSEQVALGRQVTFLDMHAALEGGDLSDGVHPNLAGYGKMAECWLPAVTSVISPLGTSSPPAIVRLDSRTDLTHLTVKFSKPLDDASAAIENFSLSGGVSVLHVELDSASKRVITLTTSPQNPSTLYVLSVQGVRDRTPQQNTILPDTTREFTSRTLIDGSFEADGQGWAFSGNNFVVGSVLPATDGTKLLVFNGAEAAPDGSVSQVVDTVPGEKYKLAFDMGVNGGTAPQSLNVKVMGNFPLISQSENLSGPGGGATQWVNKDYEFVANSETTTVTFEDNSTTTNSVDLLLDDVRMNIQITPVLTVTSTPYTATTISVSPLDLNSNGTGSTNFTRSYNEGTSITLTASATSGGLNFEKWQKDGVNYSTATTINVTMDANHTMKAVYSILTNGSFEQGTADGDGVVANVTGWTGSGNRFGYVSNGPYQANDGTRLMVFNGGPSTPNGVLSQSFPTVPGQSYVLDFYMASLGVSEGVVQQVQVGVAGIGSLLSVTDSATSLSGQGLSWQLKSHTFTADSATTTLTFTDVSSTSSLVDLLLDGASVRLSEANTAPVASDDSYSVTQNSSLVISPTGVLANDTDAQSDPLTAIVNVGPAHGSLTLNLNGGFTYTPTTGYTGSDSFTYHANDGTLNSNVATVTITVNPPVSQLLTNGSFELGTADGNGVVTNVTGWTGSGNQFGYVGSAPYLPTEGARLMVFNGGPSVPNGVISQSFTTTPGQAYLLEFDMGVVGVAGQPQQFAVTVAGTGTLLSLTDVALGNGPSTSAWAAKKHYFVANSATTTLTFTDTSSNIEFVDLLLDNVKVTASSSRVLSLMSTPTGGAAVTVSPADINSETDGVTSFTRGYANGASVSLTAAAANGGQPFVKWQKNGVDFSNNAAISVTMDGNHVLNAVYQAGNTAPVAVADSYSVNQDVSLIVPQPGVLANDTDAQSNPLTAALNAGPAHGSLTLNPNGGFTYTPTTGYNGPDSFTYHANDGSLDSNVVTVSITVNPAGSEILTNGSFEAGTTGWTVSGNQFAYTQDGTYVATDGVKLMIFNGGGAAPNGVISQTFSTTPGQVYTLTFDIGAVGTPGGSQDFAVLVTGATTLLSQTDSVLATSASASNWAAQTHTFTADSSTTTLQFTDVSSTGNFIDALLDHVRVVANPNRTLTVTSSPSTGVTVTVTPADLASSANGVTNFTRTYSAGANVNLTAPLMNGAAAFVKWQKNGTDYSTNAVISVAMDANITMNAVYFLNSAPVAVADTYSVVQNVALTVPAAGVLSNDSDVDPDTLSAILVASPTHGSLTLNPNGGFIYTPASGYIGSDSFTYKANDGHLDSNVVSVSLDINPPIIDLVTNGSFELGTPADFGTLESWAVSGTVVGYTNQGDYIPTHLTRLALFNSGGNSFGSTISQVLTTVPGQAYRVEFDAGITGAVGTKQSILTTVTGSVQLLSKTEVLFNPASFQWYPLSYTFVADNTSTTLTFLDNSATLAAGETNFSDLLLDHVRVTTIGNARMLTVNSTPVSSLPVTVSPNDLGGSSNGSTSFTRSYSSGTSVTLTALAASGPNVFQKWQKNGSDVTTSTTTTVVMDGNHTMTAVYIVDNTPRTTADSYSTAEDTPLTVPAAGVLANDVEPNSLAMTAVLNSTTTHGVLVLNANGGFTYTPAADYNGPDSFSYRASNGTLSSAITTVTLNVTPVNDPSSAVPQTVTTAEDTPLPITLVGNDVDGDTLTYVTTNPAHGVLSGTSANLTYTPTLNYNGPDSFTFTVNDGSGASAPATVSITVTPVADPPVADNQTVSLTANTSLPITLTGSDPDDDTITYQIVASPTNGTLSGTAPNITYTPGSTFVGSDSFTFKTNDGTTDSATATVSITVNGVLKNGSFETVSGSPSVPTFWTTSGNFVIKTGTGSLPSTHPTTTSKMISFNDGNLAANAVVSQTFATTPGRPYDLKFSLGAFAGTFQHRLRVTLTGSSLIKTEDFPITGPGGTSYIWTEKATTFIANSTTTTLQFLDAPATSAVGNNSDMLLDNVRLDPQLTHTLTVESSPNAGVNVTVSPSDFGSNGNGVTSFTRVYLNSPAVNLTTPAAVGAFNFQKWTRDGVFYASTPAVSVTLSSDYRMTAVYIPNAPPVAAADSYTTDEDVPLVVTAATGVLANDTDPELVALTAVLDVAPTHGTLTLNANGGFTYTPTLNYSGPDSFTYHANDGAVSSAITTVTLTVNPVNDAPVAVADSASVAEDGVLHIAAPGVLSNDTDVDSSSITAVLNVGPTHGTLTLNADGSYDYTPALNFNGTDSFTYHATDGTASSNIATVTITVTPVNDAPVAVADSGTTAEDTPLVVAAPGVLGNDTDVDLNLLTAVLNVGPTHGTLVLNANGGYTYTPALNYNGTDSFTYHANDGTASSNIVTVSLTVTPVNDAPVAVADSASMAEDDVLHVGAPGVLSNDTDVESDPVTAVLNAGPSHGTLVLNANGSYDYTPALNFNGTDSFTYHATDGTASSNIVTVTITVAPVNDEPVAVADSTTTNEDVVLHVAAPGVLGNDSDVDLDTLTAVLNVGPTHGTLVLNANGSYDYTPALNYNGTDSFTYHASDGTVSSNIVTVTITVNPVNDAPVAVADSATTAEDTPLTVAAPGVLANDTDVEANTLTAVLDVGPSHGTLVLNADGSYTYTPTLNFNGTDSFTYHASDGTASSNIATVTITVTPVNDAPVAVADAATTDEDTVLHMVAPGVLANDSDVDLNPLTAVLEVGPSNGTLVLNANGSYDYTPALNFNGSDSFTYRATDGTLNSNIATVTITVNPVNDAPVAVADSATTAEDTALVVTAPGVLTNDTDVESNPLTAVVEAGPAHGTLTLNANCGYTYTPSLNFNGTDSFTYRANDGTAASDIATVTITVTPVNDAPVAVADSATTAEDTVLHVTAPGVLANDTDVDLDTLTAVLNVGPSHGTLTLNANGSYDYTPALNFNGTDSFTYHATDGTASSNIVAVTITVTPVNDAPVAVADSATTAEDTPLTVVVPGVLANDSDVDLNALMAILETGPAHGTLDLHLDGSYVYTPSLNFNGTDSFTYYVSDGSVASNIVSVTITVTPVNDAPVAVADSATTVEDTVLTVIAPGVLANDTDVESDALTAVLESGPSHGTLDLHADGSYSYTPALNFNGTDSFTYRAKDGNLTSNIATVTITVTTANDAPVAVADSATTAEDTVLHVTAPGVLGNDTDVDLDTLTAVLNVGPTHGTLTLNANGSYDYTPALNFNGTDSFTYHATDGTASSNIVAVTITVTPVNDAPVAVADVATTAEDTVLHVTAPGVLAHDSDVDLDTLTAVLNVGPANGTLTLNANGSYDYTPALNFNGTDSFSYHATDGTASSSIVTVTITVTPVNDAPVAVADAATTAEDTPLVVAAPGVLANDSDLDLNSLTAVLDAGPAHGTLTLNANGGYTYTPALNFNGTDSFTYHANDGTASSNVATVTITVTPVNDAPVAVADSATTAEDTPLTVAAPGVLSNDTDAELDSLTAVLEVGPTHGTLVLNTNGSYTYTPQLNFNGTDSFTYHAADGSLSSNIATVTITVTPVNDAPVALAQSLSVDEDGSLPITLAGTDVEGSALTFVEVGTPLHGSLTGTAPNLVYHPAPNYNGTDSFTFKVSDGSLTSSAATISIVVNSVVDDGFATWLAGFGLTGNPGEDPDKDGISNAVEFVIGGDPKNRSDVNLLPTVALANPAPNENQPVKNYLLFTYRRTDLAKNDEKTSIRVDWSTNLSTWTNTQGTSGVLFEESDEGAGAGVDLVKVYIPKTLATQGKLFARLNVVIDVPHVNNAPVAQPQNLTVNQGSSLPITLVATDVDGDALTYNVTVPPAHGTLSGGTGASRTYTPTPSYSGPDSFTYVANDGTSNSAPVVVQITVNPVNFFNQWMAGYGLTGTPGGDSDSDSISNAVEYVIGGNPANASSQELLPTVSFVTADPDGNSVNSDYMLFTYRRTDLANTDPSTVIKAKWSTSLTGSWTNADGTAGVVIHSTGTAVASGIDLVRVYIPRSLAVNGRLFARLDVAVTVP